MGNRSGKPRPMKWTISTSILALVACAAPAFGSGQTLKSAMRAWKPAALVVSQMASGAASFDEQKARSAIEMFVADSQALRDRLSATSAAARDLKLRFTIFNADSASALASIGSRDKFSLIWTKVRAECQSCHDQYAN